MSRFTYCSMLAVVSLWSGSSGADAECTINPGFEGLNTSVQGFPVPATSPVQGVERLRIEQLDQLFKDDAYVFIDVRPPGFFKACRLKGSLNLEYTFAGPQGEQMYKTDKRITKPVLEELIAQGKVVVLFCNDAFSAQGCHRAANAVITAVCEWGLPSSAVKWFGEGVSGTVPARPDLIEGAKCVPPWH